MTDRLRAVLDQVADEMPRPHVMAETWARRGGRGAAGRSRSAWRESPGRSWFSWRSRRCRRSSAARSIRPLPQSGSRCRRRWTRPWSHTSSVRAAPPGRASVAVKGALVRRNFFRVGGDETCGQSRQVTCHARHGMLVVGPDMEYRLLGDSVFGIIRGALLSPDGRHAAVPVGETQAVQGQPVDVVYRIQDLATGDLGTPFRCRGDEPAWTRAGAFACAHPERDGWSRVDLHATDGTVARTTWRLRETADGTEWLEPRLIHLRRFVRMAASRDGDVVEFVDPTGRVVSTVRPQGCPTPARWPGALSTASSSRPPVGRGGRRARRAGAPAAGAAGVATARLPSRRLDPLMRGGPPIIAGVRFVDPAGRTSELRVPSWRLGDPQPPVITSVAIDALDWTAAEGAAAHTPASLTTWLDEAALLAAVAVFALLRRWRRRSAG